jgi:hypothetical protein
MAGSAAELYFKQKQSFTALQVNMWVRWRGLIWILASTAAMSIKFGPIK